ncbi:MAG: peptidylprolyl isomerase [Candidatus Subteraquimicrobiales bacterium]|nr:peptidylprolyl isomerase [Candidatus Subteraquimicrobiales bacterium]
MNKANRFVFLLGVMILLSVLSGCAKKARAPATNTTQIPQTNQETMNQQTATIKIARGEFAIALDSAAAPKTVENFVAKSKAGCYKDKIFHRVENWVVQGGDPSGNGTGGGDQTTELSDRNFAEGAVGVARAGDIKVSNDSQFFICTTDCSFLNNQYTYFGKVTSGMDIVKKTQVGDKIDSIEVK